MAVDSSLRAALQCAAASWAPGSCLPYLFALLGLNLYFNLVPQSTGDGPGLNR
uniref:Uncharacterized protein n=2 Tax=Oryza TaxID=4527 RepID=Q6YU94_ORYSJ|nr:hypothetical protein [Oryza sativa Japonica Group]BAD08184.1 hypothetical protein [Oryza sativa Japonica Group]